MKSWRRILRIMLAGSAILAIGVMSAVQAADHTEAPGTLLDPAADIDDFYAWHTANGTIIAILTFDGLQAPGGNATYDADVLYGIHIDNDADNVADIDIWVRFALDGQGRWGMQVMNLPGTGAPVWGSVEQVIDAPGGKVYAGLRDDPFFFDFQGFSDTLANGSLFDGGGNLYFDTARDSFAGTNVTAIVLEMDMGAALGGATSLQMWATTGRI